MVDLLCIGLGGGLGSIARYGLSLIGTPGDLPLMTLLTNVLGALLIGFVVGATAAAGIPRELNLFLKVGVCGGFTTFSTFSLETLTLIQSGKLGLAALYALASVILCVLGVAAGNWLATRTFAAI